VAALVAVNPRGSATIGSGRHFWSAPFEIDGEFGGLGWPASMPADASSIADKFANLKPQGANTTIGIIATDARLTKAGCKRMAIAAHSGMSRAIWPAHTPVDGDLVFGVSTGDRTLSDADLVAFHAAATATMARAIARAVCEARPQPGDLLPCWST
jgi:L-aminopeptidase/D-esterase-like protein